MIQLVHKYKPNFCRHRHHLLWKRKQKICDREPNLKDKLLFLENKVCPKNLKLPIALYAVRFSIHYWLNPLLH